MSDQPNRRKPPKGARPAGSTHWMAARAREWAENTGDLPHEILLKIARGQAVTIPVLDPNTGHFVLDEDGHFKRKHLTATSLDDVIDAAKAAAPFFAPKISTVQMIQGVPDHELDEFIARAAAEAGIDLGIGGEGQEEQEQADDFSGGDEAEPELPIRKSRPR